jgi:hypothetical protein
MEQQHDAPHNAELANAHGPYGEKRLVLQHKAKSTMQGNQRVTMLGAVRKYNTYLTEPRMVSRLLPAQNVSKRIASMTSARFRSTPPVGTRPDGWDDCSRAITWQMVYAGAQSLAVVLAIRKAGICSARQSRRPYLRSVV